MDGPAFRTYVEQVRAVAVSRVGRRIGRVESRRMADVDAALRLHLAL